MTGTESQLSHIGIRVNSLTAAQLLSAASVLAESASRMRRDAPARPGQSTPNRRPKRHKTPLSRQSQTVLASRPISG